MWWNAREMLRNGETAIDIQDSKLIQDLVTPKYKITADKMVDVESKDEIKKRIGRSTDYGDSFIYAIAPRYNNKQEAISVKNIGVF